MSLPEVSELVSEFVAAELAPVAAGAGVELVGEDFGVEEGDGDGDGLGKVFGGGGGAELLVL